MTPSGIEPATSWFITHCLNQLRHRVPPFYDKIEQNLFVVTISLASSMYRVIHKSVKHFKNLQQIDYATDHGNSYVDRERNCLSFF